MYLVQIGEYEKAGGALLLICPIVAACWFVLRYGHAFPMTDGWLFLRALIHIEGSGFGSLGATTRSLHEFPTRIYDHHVIVPFVLYLPIARLTTVDARALMALTLSTCAIQLGMYRYFLIRSNIWAVPIALVLFSPARYVEFLWGFEFTLALSVVFPIAGLFILGRIKPDDSAKKSVGLVGALIGLSIAGTLSSAGGFFGFPAAAALIIAKRLSLKKTAGMLAAVLGAAVAVFLGLMGAGDSTAAPGSRELLFLTTSLGATILGMPIALDTFSVNALSLLGMGLMAAMVAAILVAIRRDIVNVVALPIGLFVYSVGAVIAIGLNRAYLANWHLMYAVPAVCAVYCACYLVFRNCGTRRAGLLLAAVAASLLLTPIGYYHAFVRFGPEYDDYAQRLQNYARSYLELPGVLKPFPPTGGWDLDAEMVRFLFAKGHQVFAQEIASIRAGRRTAVIGATVFVNGEPTTTIPDQPQRGHRLIVVALPPHVSADAVIVATPANEILLRRTDPSLTAPAACPDLCFSGLILAGSLAGGAGPLRVIAVTRNN